MALELGYPGQPEQPAVTALLKNAIARMTWDGKTTGPGWTARKKEPANPFCYYPRANHLNGGKK